ncbi:ribonuclease III [Synechocystis sp. PCC 7509]|uniref:ribonuclease III n=1 Tax=Synechocystis sp. PCC 7509 TaxID=927677 RepID=UPI0002ABF283|nr:ribonuclease III [Synechocystis sp. PCC 7509]
MSKLPEFRNPSLLRLALTHSSYMHENPGIKGNNERLEFLGDALLGLLIAERLYHKYPDMDEGQLTKLRSTLVDEQQLAKFARKLNIGGQMLLGNGAKLDGGCHNSNLLSSTFEAVIGAYFLDSGIQATSFFVESLVMEVAEHIVDFQSNKNYKGMLQEWSKPQFGEEPKYDLVSESGADHNKEFIFKVSIKGKEYGRGKGHRIKEAQKNAAENALKKLGLL